MKPFNLIWIMFLLGTVLVSACQSKTSSRVLGQVAVEGEQVREPRPRQAPAMIYVTHFVLDAEHFQGDEGVRGMLPGRLRERAASRLAVGVAGPFAAGDPEAEARNIVTAMSNALVKSLTERGMPAQALDPAKAPWPGEGWMISGVFTEVDEGNRIKRAAIGFGRGATQMDVQVMVSDLSGPDPRAPFVIFGTVKEAGKVPGAVVTMNPYVAAARFVMEKGATDKDIEKTAELIAQEVLKFRDAHAPGRPESVVP